MMFRCRKQVVAFAMLAALVVFNIIGFSDKSNRRLSIRRMSDQDGLIMSGMVQRKENVEDKEFTFIHIPKSGGSSFLVESPRHMREGSTMKGNLEQTIFKTKSKRKDTIVFLRDPDRHVLSQYMECKYDKWGIKVTSGTGFPGRDYMDVPLGGFRPWVTHFVEDEDIIGRTGAYNCYNPWNMQARYLTVDAELPHFIQQRSQKEPSLDAAIENLNSLGLVGISDFYDASVCLFEYKALGELLPGCKCNDETQTLVGSEKAVHITHHVPKHNFDDVWEVTKDMVRKLTKVDRALYEYALKIFSEEIKKVADETGVDLLCGITAVE